MGEVIGVNHTSIYRVFFMCLCNLNARFTPVFLKITLIPQLLMFCMHGKKSKQIKGKNLSKKNHILSEALVHRGNGVCSLRQSSSPRRRKRFTAVKL